MEKGISSIMLKKLTGFITHSKEGEINSVEAERIQKAAYALSHAEVKKKFSPTYQTIQSGLDSEDKQVFEGSLYYLVKIAQNKPKYKKHIKDILQAKIEEKEINPDFLELIRQKINILN